MKRVNMGGFWETLMVSVISIFLIAGCGDIAGRVAERKIITQTVPENEFIETPLIEKQMIETPFIETKIERGADEKIIEIKEKLFIAQTNDVYLNAEDYLGKTIKLQGLFKKAQYETREAPYCFVLRYGPGCCGYDGNAGFEVAWLRQGGGAGHEYPEEDDWVEAVGSLKSYTEDGYPYLYIELESLTVLEERGAEFVTQ
jgi:uncharacterized membrane protein YcgQ (UPF0703/DUF1980 family)